MAQNARRKKGTNCPGTALRSSRSPISFPDCLGLFDEKEQARSQKEEVEQVEDQEDEEEEGGGGGEGEGGCTA